MLWAIRRKIMTREKKYEEQLRGLGIWQEAFAPAVRELADMERELQRLRKRWKERGSPINKDDKLYPAIQEMRRDILAHRDALGLTPKSLRRFRAAVGETPEDRDAKPTVLALIQDKRRKEA